MRLKKESKIEKICISKKDHREVLKNCHLVVNEGNREESELMATDGKMAVILPVEAGEHDTTGTITIEALQAGRKASSKYSDINISANGSLAVENGPTFKRPDLTGFPTDNMRSLFPKEAGKIKVAIDAEKLKAIADAFGGTGRVVLEFDEELNKPVLVTPTYGGIGKALLMKLDMGK